MKYYHGSRTRDLKKLSIDKSNDGYVWLTEQYEFAVLYAGNSVRFWDYNFKTNKLIIREIAENCFKKMYKGVDCYIYIGKNIGEFDRFDHRGRRSIRCGHDVDLVLFEHIPDVYDKIMELYRDGVIELQFWEDYSPKEQEEKRYSVIRQFAPVMQEEYEKLRDEYNLITELIPELKLENLENNNQGK